MRPGDRVAIVGCGGVGLSALLGAVAAGAEPVIAVDVARGKLGVARELRRDAGSALGRARPEATAEAVREATGGGVDYAIEATGTARGDAARVPRRRAPAARRC